MNHICTFETAKKLADNGFGQPSPSLGQFWYDRNGFLWVVGTNKSDFVFRSLGDTWREWPCEAEGFVFAPTATDILALFPPTKGVFVPQLPEASLWFSGHIGWRVRLREGSFAFEGANSAEVCAEGFLTIAEK